jgi:hypothetical protein
MELHCVTLGNVCFMATDMCREAWCKAGVVAGARSLPARGHRRANPRPPSGGGRE